MDHENGGLRADQSEVISVEVKTLCLVWKKWETMKDVWEELIWYKTLDFSQKKCERDTGMGQKEGTLPGKWGNEPQVNFPMMTNGRERFPRHLSVLLCDDSSMCLARTVSQLYEPYPWVALWVLHCLLACPLPINITISLQCQHLTHTSLSSAHSHWPWPNGVSNRASGLLYSITAWHKWNKYLLSYQQLDHSPLNLYLDKRDYGW